MRTLHKVLDPVENVLLSIFRVTKAYGFLEKVYDIITGLYLHILCSTPS